jgi:crossover junction endodeoxyribonuclease RusA
VQWVLDLFVAGIPAPQGSKRHVGDGVMIESCERLGDWRSVMAWSAANAYRDDTGRRLPPLTGAVVLVAEFVMPRIKSLPKRKPTPPHTKRPDVDKLLRSVGDAMKAVVWADDSQLVEITGTKRYAEPDEQPGAHLLVGERGPAELAEAALEPAAVDEGGAAA